MWITLIALSFLGYYRIGIDEWLRVPSVEDVFAVGDCAGFIEQTGRQVLPALAQVRYPFSFQFLLPILYLSHYSSLCICFSVSLFLVTAINCVESKDLRSVWYVPMGLKTECCSSS